MQADGAVMPSVPGSGAVNSALRVVVHNWFVDGAMDGALDGPMDGASDGALDGVVDGAVDGAAEGVAAGATSMTVQGSVSATRCSVVPSVPGSGAVKSALRVVVHNCCVGFR